MKRSLNIKKSATALALVAAILFSVFSMAFTASAASDTLTANVALNLRAAESASSSSLAVIPAGGSVTLLADSTNGWANINYNGKDGYASTEFLNKPNDSAVTMSGVTTAAVNLRSQKNTSSSVLIVVPKEQNVTVIDNSDAEWAKATYQGNTGYISKDYIRITFMLGNADSDNSAAVSATQSSETSAPAASSGFSYRSVTTSDLPNVYDSSRTDELTGGTGNAKWFVLNRSSAKLDAGETFVLAVYDNAVRVQLSDLSFSSSDKNIASVSSNGTVKGISGGTAVITAKHKYNGQSATCSVKVTGSIAPETQAPTQKPTQAATQKPTQKATQAPTQAPTQKPTTAVAETLSLNKSSDTVYVGCYGQIIATSNVTVTWSSSNTSVATVSSAGIVTGKSVGTATITAKTSTKTAKCKVSVINGNAVYISNTTVTTTAGKTTLLNAGSGVSWTSSNTAVATVSNGYVLAKKKGYAVITATTGKGANTCLVKVNGAAPIRFAYTSPNCAAKNQKVTLVAITDNKRTAVRFQVTEGDETRTVNATSKTADGNNYIWKGTTTFKTAGTHTVVAYSEYSSQWYTCADAQTTAFVVNTTDMTTTVCANRRASDDVIKLIATFEGFISNIYDDPITGDPTIGHGRVIFAGQQFYNGISKNEAYAYLVQTVNNDGYATKVNNFFVDNSVKFNQRQFDALVCFVYNCGTGPLSDSLLKAALLDCSDGSGSVTSYYITGSAVRIRKGPGTDYDIIRELAYGTTLKILSTSNSAWYQVQLNDGTKGYVSSSYIGKKTTGGKLDLNYINKQNLINNFCVYHHAAGSCIWGLFYRRIDEMEMFFYGDYSPCYGSYKYNISYTCKTNPSYHT